MDRASVNVPLHTGIKAIDSMIPVGRGQRELIIGDRYTGKTTVAIDTILNQKSEPKAVSATRSASMSLSVRKRSKTAQASSLQLAAQPRARLSTPIVVDRRRASAPAAPCNTWRPLPAPQLANILWRKGMGRARSSTTTFPSKRSRTARCLALLAPPAGPRGVSGRCNFYLHSRFCLERAAKLNKEKGGGSLTALPIIETQEGDVSGYIPTNVISITDGQIFLRVPHSLTRGHAPRQSTPASRCRAWARRRRPRQ